MMLHGSTAILFVSTALSSAFHLPIGPPWSINDARQLVCGSGLSTIPCTSPSEASSSQALDPILPPARLACGCDYSIDIDRIGEAQEGVKEDICKDGTCVVDVEVGECHYTVSSKVAAFACKEKEIDMEHKIFTTKELDQYWGNITAYCTEYKAGTYSPSSV